MIAFLKFISNFSLWLSAACVIFLALALRAWWLALREYQDTIYSLEKEVAARRARNALAVVALMALISLLIFYANETALNTPDIPAPTPTSPFPLRVFTTATPTLVAASPTPGLPTPTPLRPQPSPTPRLVATNPPAPLPPALPPVCPNPGVRITSPGVNTQLLGATPIIGSANIANFQFYKLEYGLGEAPQQWNVFGDVRRQIVNDGLLGTLNASALPSGVYRIQLTVVDSKGQFPPPCSVRVVIGE